MMFFLSSPIFSVLFVTFLLTCSSDQTGDSDQNDPFPPPDHGATLGAIHHFDPEAFAPVSQESLEYISDPRFTFSANYGFDPILEWNLITLDANALDHSLPMQDQGGPTRTSRAFAIVHIAMYEAANAILDFGKPYLNIKARRDINPYIAVAAAAHKALWHLYPQQRATFDRALHQSALRFPYGWAEYRGYALGRYVARRLLELREQDGSQIEGRYVACLKPGIHQVDPLNPDQGFLTPAWGSVIPFAIPDVELFKMPPPPPLNSREYLSAYQELLRLGGDGVTSPTERTIEEGMIGTFWGYDGTPGIGTPPRLYNQITRVIAQQEANNIADNARLFALVNTAMADSGIQSWKYKYDYAFWRPIVAIRNGDKDGNSGTPGIPGWRPLGSPASNGAGINFSPNFPAYASGHASFGAAAFRSIANFYGRDDISFSFTSDEFNGRTRDADGSIRPVVTRYYSSLSEASEENGQSRIYLGIHWRFDKTEGIRSGNQVADYISSRFFLAHHRYDLSLENLLIPRSKRNEEGLSSRFLDFPIVLLNDKEIEAFK